MHENLIKQLMLLLTKDNFPPQLWENHGLIISPPEICANLNHDYKKLVKSTIEQLQQNATKAQITKQLSKKLRTINKIKYDTEEKELLMERVFELSQILEIDLKFAINRWVYGYILAKLFAR